MLISDSFSILNFESSSSVLHFNFTVIIQEESMVKYIELLHAWDYLPIVFVLEG